MVRNLSAPHRSLPSLILLLALGCGDPVADAGDDEAADDTTGDTTVGEGSGEASDNVEAGSEGNDTTADESGSSESGTASDTVSETSTQTDTDADVDTTEDTTETGGPDCTMLDEPTCNGTDTCVPYMGVPYTVTGDGTICLGEPEFIGCLFAADACLPATGTLCMGDDAFHVDNLCPPPEGFESCEPPVDPVLPCMP